MGAASSSGGDRLLASVAYIGPLVIIPILRRGKDRYLGFHTRQATYMFVVFVAAFLLTLGLLYFFQSIVDARPVFNTLAVVFLMEVVVYVLGSLYLAVQAGRGNMPMVPVLGELSGEA